MNQPTELKPCPFCGSAAILKTTGASDSYVECRDKGCVSQIGLYQQPKYAAEDWNTRALDTLQPDAGLVEEYKERSDAWEEVWAKCLALGADSSSHDKGIDVILNFIEALAQHQHRQGEQWSDTPGERLCRNCKWWDQYSGMTSGDCRGAPPSPRMPIEDGRGGEGIFPITESKCYCAKWYGPITPPGGK